MTPKEQNESRMWSPFEIKIILHHFSSTAVCEHSKAPIYPDTIVDLVDLGVLERRPECVETYQSGETPFRTTPMGRGLVELWCQQPLPVVRYADPRFEGVNRDD